MRPLPVLLLAASTASAVLAAACGRTVGSSGAQSTTPPLTPTPTPTGTVSPVDADHDGIPDATEAQWADEYLPFVSLTSGEQCGTPAGYLYRVRFHPEDPQLIEIRYDHLYNTDCGALGHDGDDENFAVTVDPSQPGPQGILAIKAISHRNTICEKDTTCGTLPGLTACDLQLRKGLPYPVVYASQNKHGDYVSLDACNSNCFDTCALVTTAADGIPMQNAGEWGAPLTTNLSMAGGFVTTANGWSHSELLNYDPWSSSTTFGGAGIVEADLTDAALVPPTP